MHSSAPRRGLRAHAPARPAPARRRLGRAPDAAERRWSAADIASQIAALVGIEIRVVVGLRALGGRPAREVPTVFPDSSPDHTAPVLGETAGLALPGRSTIDGGGADRSPPRELRGCRAREVALSPPRARRETGTRQGRLLQPRCGQNGRSASSPPRGRTPTFNGCRLCACVLSARHAATYSKREENVERLLGDGVDRRPRRTLECHQGGPTKKRLNHIAGDVMAQEHGIGGQWIGKLNAPAKRSAGAERRLPSARRWGR